MVAEKYFSFNRYSKYIHLENCRLILCKDEERRNCPSRVQDRIQALRNGSILPFVSNLPDMILKTELQCMFCRAGKIADLFIPKDKTSGKNRGFALFRFRSEKEASRAIDLS